MVAWSYSYLAYSDYGGSRNKEKGTVYAQDHSLRQSVTCIQGESNLSQVSQNALTDTPKAGPKFSLILNPIE